MVGFRPWYYFDVLFSFPAFALHPGQFEPGKNPTSLAHLFCVFVLVYRLVVAVPFCAGQ